MELTQDQIDLLVEHLHKDDAIENRTVALVTAMAVSNEKMSSMNLAVIAHIEADRLAFLAVQKSIDEHNKDIKDVLAVMNAAKGGWRMVLLIGTILTAIGAGAAFLLGHLTVAFH